jgi:murein DD-endopeptidase MepM/ murein hydrolase activator NlpD
VAATALLGAGVVAVATAAAMPDMKVSDAGSLATLAGNSTSISRSAVLNRASRSNDRTSTAADATAAPDIWRLPMTGFTIATAPFGERSGMLGRGVDLVAPVGTPLYAAHSGTITMARWYGGYGYTVIVDVVNGVQLVYAHASALLVHEGQHVDGGQLVALSGNSGYSFAPHVHFEVRVNGVATDASQYLSERGVYLSTQKDTLSE